MKLVYILLISAFVLLLLWFNMRKEKWSDYNVSNDFMKIYYSNIVEDPNLAKKFPFFGTGNYTGLRCKKPNNGGCDTIWVDGKLVERTKELNEQLKCRFGI